MFNFNNLTEVVKNLLIINILFFIGSYVLLGDEGRYLLAMFFPDGDLYGRVALFGTSFYIKFYPFQVVTHMFMHANIMHILFNMMVLVFFGPLLEYRWGAKKFLFYYFACGFGAAALHLLVTWIEIEYFGGSGYPVLGASGAMMGIMVAFGVTYPNETVYLLIPPIPLKAKYMVMLLIAIDLFLGFGGFNSGIAHFAHLGGALMGFILLFYWRRFGSSF